MLYLITYFIYMPLYSIEQTFCSSKKMMQKTIYSSDPWFPNKVFKKVKFNENTFNTLKMFKLFGPIFSPNSTLNEIYNIDIKGINFITVNGVSSVNGKRRLKKKFTVVYDRLNNAILLPRNNKESFLRDYNAILRKYGISMNKLRLSEYISFLNYLCPNIIPNLPVENINQIKYNNKKMKLSILFQYGRKIVVSNITIKEYDLIIKNFNEPTREIDAKSITYKFTSFSFPGYLSRVTVRFGRNGEVLSIDNEIIKDFINDKNMIHHNL